MTRAARIRTGREAFAWDVVFPRHWHVSLRPLVQSHANSLGGRLLETIIPFDMELDYSVSITIRDIARAIELGWIDEKLLGPTWRRRWRDPEKFRAEVRGMLRRAVEG